MRKTTFTEFRNNAKKFFDAVEGGEPIEVYRKGKLSAIILPAEDHNISNARWKKDISRKIIGLNLSKALQDERKHSK